MRRVSYFLVVLLFFTRSANADYYTIQDAIKDARANNYALKTTIEQSNAKRLGQYAAIAEMLPVAGFKMNARTANKMITYETLNEENTHSRLVISQNIFASGASLARLSMSRDRSNIGDYEKFLKVSDIFLDVIDAYHSVILARRVLQINMNNQEAVRHKLEKIKARFAVGEITKTDVFAAEYNLASALSKTENAKGQVAIADAKFFHVIGRAPSQELLHVNAAQVDIPETFEEFLENVLNNNLNIKIAKKLVYQSETNTTLQMSELMPKLNMQIEITDRQERGATPTDAKLNTIYGLELSIPIVDASKYIHVREAKYNANAAEASYYNTLSSVRSAAVEVWQNKEVTIAQIEASEKAETAAKEALDGIQQEYQIGTKTTYDLLMAQQQLFDVQIQKEQLKKNLVLAVFKIKYFIGRLYLFNFNKVNE